MWMRKREQKKGMASNERELWMHMLSRLTFNCSIESVVSNIQNHTLFSMPLVTCKTGNEESQLLYFLFYTKFLCFKWVFFFLLVKFWFDHCVSIHLHVDTFMRNMHKIELKSLECWKNWFPPVTNNNRNWIGVIY